MAFVNDTSAARLNLLHMLYTQLLANQMTHAHMPRGSSPPLREPRSANPFGYLQPTGGIAASATHGAGYSAGGNAGKVTLVGQSLAPPPIIGQPIVAGGPITGGIIGSPAVRPPAGLPPLPR
jgi:hypothetical protein